MNITKHRKSWTCCNSLEKSQVISKNERNKLNTSFRKNWKRDKGQIDNTNSKMESWGVRKITVQTVFEKMENGLGNILEKKRQNSEVVKKGLTKNEKVSKHCWKCFFTEKRQKWRKKWKIVPTL